MLTNMTPKERRHFLRKSGPYETPFGQNTNRIRREISTGTGHTAIPGIPSIERPYFRYGTTWQTNSDWLSNVQVVNEYNGRLNVDRQPDAGDHQPAAARHLGEAALGAEPREAEEAAAARARGGGEGARTREGGAGALQEEIDAYKTMMGCNVCKQRDKACVITKCFHMFCRECIDTRIATRQRKCPGCALAFSENDVQNIYF